MKKLTYLLFFLACPYLFLAQYRWDVGGGIGLANYLGDIGGKANTRRDFVADMKMAKTRLNASGFARMRIFAVHGLSWKVEFNYLMIEGSDKLSTNPGRMYRNLDFRNHIFELNNTMQWVLFEHLDMGRSYRYRNTFRTYVFGGIGLFYHSPKGMYNGEWVNLRPLTTEGKKYSPLGFCIPAGVGMAFTIRKRHRITWELNWRTTFTDYLDDISTNYADPGSLPSDISREMANKTDESAANSYAAGFSNNYNAGAKRGDGRHNDSYLTTNITYSYVIRGKKRWYVPRQLPWIPRSKWNKGVIRVRIKF
jgi:hypothetical protein